MRHLLRHLIRGAVLALAVFALSPLLSWAVLVSPHAVFIEHNRGRTGQLVLYNTGSSTEEITVDLQFGYPATDSAGSIYVKLIEQPEPGEPSAAGWVRAYPRRLSLSPGDRQVVRLLATPPPGLADGEYWSRIIVTSRGAQIPVTGTDSVVRAGIAMELRTIISLTYRKGTPKTAVTLKDLRIQVEGDSLIAWMSLERGGNAAYLGTTRFQVRDSTGTVVRHHEWSTATAVYYALNRRFVFPLDSLPPGNYTVAFDLSTDREDIDQTNVLPAAAIHRSVGIQVR